MSVCLVLTIDVYVPTYLPKFSCVCKISKKGLSQLFCFNSKGTKKRRRIRFDCFLSLRFVFKNLAGLLKNIYFDENAKNIFVPNEIVQTTEDISFEQKRNFCV